MKPLADGVTFIELGKAVGLAFVIILDGIFLLILGAFIFLRWSTKCPTPKAKPTDLKPAPPKLLLPPQPKPKVIAPEPPKPPPPPVRRIESAYCNEKLEVVDEFLREVQLRQEIPGKEITVRYLASPTGRVAIEWTTASKYLRIRGYRDKQPILEAVGSGCCFEHVKWGKRCTFSFSVASYSGYTFTRDVMFTVTMPTPQQWHRTPHRLKAPMTAPAEPAPLPPEDAATKQQRELEEWEASLRLRLAATNRRTEVIEKLKSEELAKIHALTDERERRDRERRIRVIFAQIEDDAGQ